jgi:hypothetical protein
MSVVATIKRLPEKPLLTGEEFRRVVEQDSSLSGGGQEPIIWTDPTTGQERYINADPATGELETDDMRGDEDSICRFLDKLRSIARILDARVFGEGEDITEPTPAPAQRAGCASVLVCALAFVVVLVIAVSNWR